MVHTPLASATREAEAGRLLGCSALYQLGVDPCSDFSPRRKAVEELISEMINLVLGCQSRPSGESNICKSVLDE